MVVAIYSATIFICLCAFVCGVVKYIIIIYSLEDEQKKGDHMSNYIQSALSFWRACLLFALVAPLASADVHVLTNSNFEKNTQASTGSTTGNFFVKFYAPWCGHCKALAPKWEALGDASDPPVRNTLFAKVDCTGNGKEVCSRFKVRSYPTLILFAQGKMYRYDGKRDDASIRAFAEGGYGEEKGDAVPPVPNFFSKLIDTISEDMNEILDKRKNAAVALILAGVPLGFILGFFFAVCVCHQEKEKKA